MTLLLISVGGAIGALLRYACAYLLPFSSVWAIVGINCVGSFMIGCLFKQFGNQLWMFAAIGFCGAFTTFSTYSLDVIRLLMAGNIQTVLLYVTSMNGVSLLSCWLGIKLFN